jgi:hypothetical protein
MKRLREMEASAAGLLGGSLPQELRVKPPLSHAALPSAQSAVPGLQLQHLCEYQAEAVAPHLSSLDVYDDADDAVYSCDTCCHYPCRCLEPEDFLDAISNLVLSFDSLELEPPELEFDYGGDLADGGLPPLLPLPVLATFASFAS